MEEILAGAEDKTKDMRRINWPLAIAAAGALYFGLKLLTAAGGDISTALEMANLLEFLPTVAAMVISVSPVVVLPVFAAFVPYLLRARGEPGTLSFTLHVSVMSFLGLAALLFSAPIMVLVAALIIGTWVAGQLGSKRGWKHANKFRMTFDRAEQWSSGVLVIALFFGPSWLAPQAVQVNGQDTKTVFVVSQDEHRLIYLDESSKRLKRVAGTEITAQYYCSGDRPLGAPIYALFQSGETNPKCPD
ncbi:hypothetical protein [Pseudarthrobacter sp. LT1]|uniref:hypothetical protein n=1 Tax=Pseudarthrobacter sp. LT1 TaxID=3111450 RepID=UPI002D7963BD|nr:hypothetical protein [Pseudarthrobacter sp. LT1]WRT16142.1 hypothetical protein VIK36_09105 [Pseudarthrobacter sp. LT1]